jgi:hypothetical protein
MSYTLPSLITAVRDVVNDDSGGFWTDAEITRYLNDADKDIAIRSGCMKHIDAASTSTHTGSSLTFTSSRRIVPDADDDVYMRSVTYVGHKISYLEYLITGTTSMGLYHIYYTNIGHLVLQSAFPECWFEHGRNAYLDPVPDAYSINEYVIDGPTGSMAESDDSPEVTTLYHELLIVYACAQCFHKIGRIDIYSYLMSIYVSEIEYYKNGIEEIVPDTKAMTNQYEFGKVT